MPGRELYHISGVNDFQFLILRIYLSKWINRESRGMNRKFPFHPKIFVAKY